MDQAKTPNRRRSLRHPARRTTKVACYRGSLGLGKNIAIAVLDVSETGACLVLNTSLQLHEEVEVHLTGATHKAPVKVLAEVIWSVEMKDGQYCTGVAFRKPVAYRDVQAM